MAALNFLQLFALTTLLVISTPTRLTAETLGEILGREGIRSDQVAFRDLSKEVNNVATTETSDFRILSMYVLGEAGQNRDSLSDYFYVFRQDKKDGEWTDAKLDWPAIDPVLGRNREGFCDGGSITNIDALGDFIYFSGHINPSAACTMVVTRDLKFHDTFPGWKVGGFLNGMVVFHHSQVHFAPTHYVELSLYDPLHKSKRMIYPLKPYQTVRVEHIKKVGALYQACCPVFTPEKSVIMPGDDCGQRFGNHHCDPELFDNALPGMVEADSTTHSLAFLVHFDNQGFWRESERFKLQTFWDLRKALEGNPPEKGLTDGLFMSLYEDLGRARRSDAPDSRLLDLFAKDRELLELVANACNSVRTEGQNWRDFFRGLDKRWEQPATWYRLSQMIEVPPEYSEVVYIYRNVTDPGRMEWKEMLLSDVRKLFGDIPLKECLTANRLETLFRQ